MSAATASGHLQRLVAGGLVTVRSSVLRHRYYGLTGPLVAAAIEALSVISPPVEARSLRQSIAAAAMAEALSCYDHLAGRAGIALRDTLLDSGVLTARRSGDFRLTNRGYRFLSGTGTRSRSHRPITTHAGPRLPRLDRTGNRIWPGASPPPCSTASSNSAGSTRRRNDRALTITDLGHANLPALGHPLHPSLPLQPSQPLSTAAEWPPSGPRGGSRGKEPPRQQCAVLER